MNIQRKISAQAVFNHPILALLANIVLVCVLLYRDGLSLLEAFAIVGEDSFEFFGCSFELDMLDLSPFVSVAALLLLLEMLLMVLKNNRRSKLNEAREKESYLLGAAYPVVACIHPLRKLELGLAI